MAEQFRATVTPQGTGSAEAIEDVGTHQQKANAWQQLFNVGVQAVGVVTDMKEQANADQAKEDSLKGYQAGVEMRVALVDTKPQEAFSAYDTTIGEVSSGNSGASDAFNKGLLTAIKSSHVSTGLQAQEISNTQYITQASSADIINQGNDISSKTIKESIEDMHTRTNIDRAKIKDIYLANLSNFVSDTLAGVNDTDSLNGVKSQFGKLQTDLNGDPQLFGTTTTGVGGEVVRQSKANITNAFSSAQTRINTNLDREMAKSDLDFGLLPKQYEDRLVQRYGRNSKELVTKKAEYKENFDDNTKTQLLLSEGDGETGYDMIRLATTKKGVKAATEHVTAFQINAWEGNDTTKLVNSIGNSPQFSEAVGLVISKEMGGFQSEEEGTVIYNKYGTMLSEQNGPNSLNSSQGKEYKKNRLAFELWKTGAVPSVTDARENASIMTSSNTLSKTPMTRSQQSYLSKQSAKWGGESGEFRFLATNIMTLGLDPDAAVDMTTKLYDDRKKEIGDITITNAPTKLPIGESQLFSDNISKQVSTQLRLEEGEYSADDYVIKAADDFNNVGIVYAKETGLYVATVNLEEASDASVEAEGIAKIREDESTLVQVSSFFDEQGSELANVLEKYREDPTGTVLENFEVIGNFALATEGSSSREAIESVVDLIKGTFSQTREQRVQQGTQALQQAAGRRDPNAVGPAELFSAIGNFGEDVSDVVSTIIDKLTPREFRSGKVKNPQEVEIIKDINTERVREANTTSLNTTALTDTINGVVRPQEFKNLSPRVRGIKSVVNNNPGNLEESSLALPTKTGRFSKFSTPEQGVAGLARDINLKITGESKHGKLDTLESLLPVYAPPSENDTEAYIKSVVSQTGISRGTNLTKEDIPKVVAAITRHEGGKDALQYYTKSIIKDGLEIFNKQ